MKRHLQILIISFLIVLPLLTFAQEKKPKIAVVLSGGGAKGLAHIPLLQALDSLGIVPDLVIGTSMGSIVGGLYAMGYSGDSIAIISNNIDWDELLGGGISMEDVSVEEKSEFKKYLIDFDFVKGKPKVKSSLLNDQNLREYLASLTYPVYNVNNFDDLSIPFRAMATDIVNGKEVILDGGSLSLAMRASMSIPAVFQPVEYKDVLLLDGGVLNNFPVDIAKKMGADIIIGSDVGGGMEPKEELANLSTLLFQTGMLVSLLKNDTNRELCDILLDHIPNLTYSTGDFNKGKELYEEGKVATLQNMDALEALAKKLEGYNQKTHEVPNVKKEFVLDTIIYKDISEDNLDLVKARVNIQSNKKYTTNDLIEGINRAMGTNIFDQITFNPIVEENKVGVQLNGFEKAKHQIKGSIHYDTDRGIGLIANYTGRNVLGKASRLLVSIDIAEQPSFRLQYQKNFGEQKTWWWRSEALGEQLEQNVFVNGNITDDMRYRYFQFDNQINKNINSLKSFAGIGLNYEYNQIIPKVDPEFGDNVLSLDSYYFKNLEIYGQYAYNSINDIFFPTQGTYFRVKLGRSLLHDVDLTYYDEIYPRVEGTTNGFTKLSLDFEKRFQFQKKITGIIGATANFIFEDQLQSDELSFSNYGYAAKYFLGGTLVRPRIDSYVFPGLYEYELNVSQFMELDLGVQFSPINKFYLTPHFNIASVGFGGFGDYIDDAFSPDGHWQEMIETSALMSAGATFSYYSFLGPIDFDVSWVNDINKVRLFFSIGLQLNRSN